MKYTKYLLVPLMALAYVIIIWSAVELFCLGFEGLIEWVVFTAIVLIIIVITFIVTMTVRDEVLR